MIETQASDPTHTYRPSRRSGLKRSMVTVAGVALAIGLSCCSPPAPQAGQEVAWGGEAALYFEELSSAYRDHDDFRVLDFHTPVAEIERWWRALRGGGRVSDVLRWNSGDLSQDLERVFLSGDEALTLVTFASEAERAAIVIEIEDGLISHETVFDLTESLDTGGRRDPIILSEYDRIYAEYLAVWSNPGIENVSRLYDSPATVNDTILGFQGPAAAAPQPARIGSHAGGNLYLGPGDYGDDPQRAVAIYEVTDVDNCTHLMAVRWDFADGLVIHEERYHEVESVRACASVPLPEGWWTGLELPGPSDQVVTGTIETPAGRTISVRNGTPRLESTVAEGLRRFADAGLMEPRFDTLTFEPTRQCESRTGRVIETDGFRELFLCMYESDLCPRAGPCDETARTARLAVLHELGHAWMLDEVDATTRNHLLESSGLMAWSDPDVPWNERGVEYAAEILAWGLFEEDVSMVRIGSPSCSEMTAAFTVLTSTVPARTNGTCPD